MKSGRAVMNRSPEISFALFRVVIVDDRLKSCDDLPFVSVKLVVCQSSRMVTYVFAVLLNYERLPDFFLLR